MKTTRFYYLSVERFTVLYQPKTQKRYMISFIPVLAYLLQPGDFVGLTFFTSYLALLGTSVFLMFERMEVSKQWKTPMTVAIVITLIAGVQYYYMRNMWLDAGISPTQFRYIDWMLTVPLMCSQFFLILRPVGVSYFMLARLYLGALVMIVTGYMGQAVQIEYNVFWGFISSLGWAVIVYEVFVGEASQIAHKSEQACVRNGFNMMRWFSFIGWGIYPLGYMMLPGNLLHFLVEKTDISLTSPVDVMYNLADSINKIGFALVVYNIAKTSTRLEDEAKARAVQAK
jgi:bacteriorhodopsin